MTNEEMTNEEFSRDCEYFGPLISCMVDGELEVDAAEKLNEHLESCEACRQSLATFQDIDSVIYAATDTEVECVEVLVRRRNPRPIASNRENSWTRSIIRWVPLALPASVLIGLMMATTPGQHSEVTAEQIAKPLAELELIHIQHRDNQVRMLKTIELDLRAFRLELAQLQVQDESPEKRRLEEHMNQLIDRVIALSREPVE